MDETKLRAALKRYWEHMATDAETAHELYHDDVVLELRVACTLACAVAG
jgi:hypothetical protein